ncbi:MAG: PHP domain-containing protein [Desulfobacterales bacterium]|nr:PHP domain-containing protein [Desulfobacterales bacterium]
MENKIEFGKPNLKELTKSYSVMDLHFHTRYSDGINSVEAIAKRAKKLEIGIAITDHNEIKGAVEIDEYDDILSIPGIELTSKEGTHILVYFYDIGSLKKFYKDDVAPFMGNKLMSSLSLKMEDIILRAKEFKVLTIFPHPYCTAYTGICNLQFPKERLDKVFDMIDGVEVINAENLNKWNLQCALLGFNLNKAITSGSDGHTLYHMGKSVTYAMCENTRESFLDSIKNKENKIIGKEIDIFRKVTSNSMKLKSNIGNYPDIVGKNIKYTYAFINSKSKQIKDNVKRHINERITKIKEKETS